MQQALASHGTQLSQPVTRFMSSLALDPLPLASLQYASPAKPRHLMLLENSNFLRHHRYDLPPTASDLFVQPGIIRDPQLFERLRAEYPSNVSHTTKTIWYDSSEMALFLDSSPVWKAFDNYVNSRMFHEYVLAVFGDELRKAAARGEYLHNDSLARSVWYSPPQQIAAHDLHTQVTA